MRARRGSSPLARGLPMISGAWSGGAGIIPARAGFTNSAPHLRRPFWDHPRSRGVYDVPTQSRAPEGGSSPLARGLPPPARGGGVPAGIIPARAGFTLAPAGGPVEESDHPRSRGVYSPGRSRPEGNNGSSPLARGLLSIRSARATQRRIIPARAGFTAWNVALISELTDHPRSRGVYAEFAVAFAWLAGSSPLARGLLVCG